MTTREVVETALGLLRTCYVFPDLAERAAAAIEVRLAAGARAPPPPPATPYESRPQRPFGYG
jgi:hypothetical protein